MRFRTAITITLAALITAACAETKTDSPTESAQTVRVLPGDTEDHRGRLLDELGLTAEQRTQIETIFESHKTEFEAIRASREAGTDREELRAAHETLREKVHAEIEALLTESQLEQFKSLQLEHKGNGRGRMGFGGPPSPEMMAERLELRMERLTEVLGLSAEQQLQIRTLMEEKHATRLSHDLPDRDARQAARDAFRTEMQGILTDTQFAQFEQMRQGGRHGGTGFGPRHGR